VGLGVDYGTSNTVAMLGWPDGRRRPLLFDGSPLLPSAVYAETDGRLLTGADAARAARGDPGRYEPHPKRRIDDGTVLLGDAEYPVAELIAATLRRVREEAVRTATAPPAPVTLTYPATWGPARRAVLLDATRRAGMPAPVLLPEPTAAGCYFTTAVRPVPPGRCIVVYDLGAGTFDVSVLRQQADGFEVLGVDGLADFGGLDLDALVVSMVGAVAAPGAPEEWRRLTAPANPADRRHFRALWDDARAAKEGLSRRSSTGLHVPVVDRDVHIGREEFEQQAGPLLDRSVEVTRTLLRRSAVAPADVAEVLLVGGSTRVPLVATMLHRALGVAPTVREQPELVVAEGALCAGSTDRSVTRPAAKPVRDRVAFTPASGATASATRHAFVAFAIAVAVYLFTGAASQKLSWRHGFEHTVQLLSAILAVVFLVLLAYTVLLRRRPALVVDDEGMTIHGPGGSAHLRWNDLTEVEFCDNTLWVRTEPDSPLAHDSRWDPIRGATRVVDLADLHAEPDAVYAAVSRHSTVPVTVAD
jgi:molecular chaperone DnaK (HSP70)